ncbi:hypothetical protein ACFHNC_09235, partial [Falsiroseomonas sp. E2-1-a4]
RVDLDQMLAENRGQPRLPSGIPPEVEREVISKALDDHYRRVLDEPIPALGNRTPRAVVKTAKGRDNVVAWLKLLENGGARQDAIDPMGAYDFGWMWRELGLDELRR